MPEGYNFSLTTFTSSGKLLQIENALAAVAQGSTSVGIRASNGVVVVTEKKTGSVLVDSETVEKVSAVCRHIGATYSGLSPDARLLLKKARKEAEAYFLTHDEYPACKVLVQQLSFKLQEYTQSGGVRPFGVSLLLAGFDADGPGLYQLDPSGSYFSWKAAAIGKGMATSKAFLERRCSDQMELEDAIHTAILAMKESFDGQMTESNVEVGVVSEATGQFRKLSPSEVRDYLDNL